MKETYQNILNVIVIIFLLVAVILFYKQQKAISQLSSVLNQSNNSVQTGKKISNPLDQTKKISGRRLKICSKCLKTESKEK